MINRRKLAYFILRWVSTTYHCGLKIILELTIKLGNLIRVKNAPLCCLGAKCINSAVESIYDTLSGFVHNTGKQMMVAIANASTPVGESHNISEDVRLELV